jgi:phosphohistidine phosphatase SixA
MRHALLVSLSCLVVGCNGGESPTAPTRVPGNAVVEQVVRGGVVLFFRHAARDTGALPDDELTRLDRIGECAAGSELTAEGLADATAIGAAFRSLGIRQDRVVASPSCRTTQMARLAFGEHEVSTALLYPAAWPELEDEHVEMLRRLLSTAPRQGTVTVLVSHNNVLLEARAGLTLSLDQGEAAVFRPLGDRAELVGRVKKGEWIAHATPTADDNRVNPH